MVLSRARLVFVSIRAIFKGFRIKMSAIKLRPFKKQITSMGFIFECDPVK
jgi:hypothetical protein